MERIAALTCPEGKQQAFLWDSEAISQAVRVAESGAKSYIFESKLNRNTICLTLGDIRTWVLNSVWNWKGAERCEIQLGAREEASRLKVLVDNGQDPRQVKADVLAEAQAARAALVTQKNRESVTVDEVWPQYVAARVPMWGELHLRDHAKAMQPGGEPVKFAGRQSTPGALASLAKTRLVDLTPELVADWAKVEGQQRPTRARLALRLLPPRLRIVIGLLYSWHTVT